MDYVTVHKLCLLSPPPPASQPSPVIVLASTVSLLTPITSLKLSEQKLCFFCCSIFLSNTLKLFHPIIFVPRFTYQMVALLLGPSTLFISHHFLSAVLLKSIIQEWKYFVFLWMSNNMLKQRLIGGEAYFYIIWKPHIFCEIYFWCLAISLSPLSWLFAPEYCITWSEEGFTNALIIRPGQSQGLPYKHRRNSLTQWVLLFLNIFWNSFQPHLLKLDNWFVTRMVIMKRTLLIL